jgi:hypothetical protein
METNKAERLEQAVATLNDLIELARASELYETAHFLAMAKLNLLMDLNGVTEEEFHTLCITLEDGAGSERRLRVRPKRGKRIGAPANRNPVFRKPWAARDRLALLRESRVRGKH